MANPTIKIMVMLRDVSCTLLVGPSQVAADLDAVLHPRHLLDGIQSFPTAVSLEEPIHTPSCSVETWRLRRAPVAVVIAVSIPSPFAPGYAVGSPCPESGRVATCSRQGIERQPPFHQRIQQNAKAQASVCRPSYSWPIRSSGAA